MKTYNKLARDTLAWLNGKPSDETALERRWLEEYEHAFVPLPGNEWTYAYLMVYLYERRGSWIYYVGEAPSSPELDLKHNPALSAVIIETNLEHCLPFWEVDNARQVLNNARQVTNGAQFRTSPDALEVDIEPPDFSESTVEDDYSPGISWVMEGSCPDCEFRMCQCGQEVDVRESRRRVEDSKNHSTDELCELGQWTEHAVTPDQPTGTAVDEPFDLASESRPERQVRQATLQSRIPYGGNAQAVYERIREQHSIYSVTNQECRVRANRVAERARSIVGELDTRKKPVLKWVVDGTFIRVKSVGEPSVSKPSDLSGFEIVLQVLREFKRKSFGISYEDVEQELYVKYLELSAEDRAKGNSYISACLRNRARDLLSMQIKQGKREVLNEVVGELQHCDVDAYLDCSWTSRTLLAALCAREIDPTLIPSMYADDVRQVYDGMTKRQREHLREYASGNVTESNRKALYRLCAASLPTLNP